MKDRGPSLAGPSAIDHRSWSFLRIGCLVVTTLTALSIVAACGTVAVTLYRSDFFTSPPDLPPFARPLDSAELSERETACVMTDDFGPTLREFVFGTIVPYETHLEILTDRFEERHWEVFTYEGGTDRNVFLIATSPDGDTSIHYRNVTDSPWLASDPDKQYPVLVQVSIEDDCEV